MLCAFLTSTLDGVSGQLYDPVILSLVATEQETESRYFEEKFLTLIVLKLQLPGHLAYSPATMLTTQAQLLIQSSTEL